MGSHAEIFFLSDVNFDLLGDPIPEGWGKRGRPPHQPSEEKRRLVIALAAFDKTKTEIAAALGITQKTLDKHYFRELRSLDSARLRLEGTLMTSLLKEVSQGNVSAINSMWKRIDKHDLSRLAVSKARTPAAGDKPGKKKQAVEAAQGVGGKYAPPAAPRLIN